MIHLYLYSNTIMRSNCFLLKIPKIIAAMHYLIDDNRERKNENIIKNNVNFVHRLASLDPLTFFLFWINFVYCWKYSQYVVTAVVQTKQCVRQIQQIQISIIWKLENVIYIFFCLSMNCDVIYLQIIFAYKFFINWDNINLKRLTMK